MSVVKCEPLNSYFFGMENMKLACEYNAIDFTPITYTTDSYRIRHYKITRDSLAEFFMTLHEEDPSRFASFLSYCLADVLPRDSSFTQWGDSDQRYLDLFVRDLRVLGYELEREEPVVRPTTIGSEEEEKMMDALDDMLNKVNPTLVQKRRGARAVLLSEQPDSVSQAVSSCRELLNQTINSLAEGKTRKEKVLKILEGREAEVVESLAELIDSLYSLQSKGTHAESDIETALFVIKITEDALYYLLKSRAN